MVIKKNSGYDKKGWFEQWLDISFMEKLVTIMWCGFPYLIWLISDDLSIIYKLLLSIGVWISATLLCWWFGNFMSSDEREWN